MPRPADGAHGARTLAHKILEAHIVDGSPRPGAEVGIRIDQTLTQDATGTVAYLQFEALDVPRVRTELAVSYVDHNTLQTGPENADDHRYLQSAAAKYGVRFSRPGNGICHQVHLERFSVPGKTLLGSDSHTPTAGGAGMLAIGAGGLDVAVAMAGGAFYLALPRIVGVELRGRLRPWVSAKDVILELLRRLTVKGGVGRIFEYHGDGVATLSVPERATIANMGAELGATTSLFPSDAQTLRYLVAQGRERDWTPLRADPDAIYDDNIIVDLGALEPLVALPHSPDRVVPVREVAGTPVQQVVVGSCTNSSYRDLLVVARMLEGRTVHPEVTMAIAPGSPQALRMAERAGAIGAFVAAGARLLESACGPCIGVGMAPASGSVSLRSFNRNFQGRAGTPDARVYLASPETCAAAALTGVITDPRDLGIAYPDVPAIPERYVVDDGHILEPPDDGTAVALVRGPNIAPLPPLPPLADAIRAPVLLKLGDDVSTDDILPAGAKILALRSNIPALAEHVFARVQPAFARASRQAGVSIIVAGKNYGQGSSREHAALVPRTLGVAAVIAKSFARIHAANLVNFGILPLIFVDEGDYDRVAAGDVLVIDDVREHLARGVGLAVSDQTAGFAFTVAHGLTTRQREIVLAGGLLNWMRASTLAAAS